MKIGNQRTANGTRTVTATCDTITTCTSHARVSFSFDLRMRIRKRVLIWFCWIVTFQSIAETETKNTYDATELRKWMVIFGMIAQNQTEWCFLNRIRFVLALMACLFFYISCTLVGGSADVVSTDYSFPNTCTQNIWLFQIQLASFCIRRSRNLGGALWTLSHHWCDKLIAHCRQP